MWVPRSLSFRLLILTIGFVMLSEVLIYTPSIARYRLTWMQERLAAAHLAALALDATPDGMVTEALNDELLDHVGAYFVSIDKGTEAPMTLARRPMPGVEARVDLRATSAIALILDAFMMLARTDQRVFEVVGRSPQNDRATVTIVVDEGPLRAAMWDYSWRILNLSIVISLMTAALVFLALRSLMVRPMQRITESMVAFRENPEDYQSDLPDEGRRDEIGVAVRELSAMKSGLRGALRQKTRLATLGTAVNKINHDLRNMLSTATLISDQLQLSSDPQVQKVAPPLMRAIDRAVTLCSRTVNFTRDTPALEIKRVPLAQVARDLAAEFEAARPDGFTVSYGGLPDLDIAADRDQIYRVFANLASNAAAAGASKILISPRLLDHRVRVEVTDDGPGIPDHAHEKLFQPFVYSTNPDGAGLGLTIARDVAQAHGGSLSLSKTGGGGTTFVLELPIPAADRWPVAAE